MKTSLGMLLALCLAGLQFLAVSVVVFSSYLTSERVFLDHARQRLSDVGTNTIAHSKGFLKPALSAAELAVELVENRIISSENQPLLEKFLFQQLRTAPQFAGIFYGDEDGNFVYVKRSEGPGEFRSKIVSYSGQDRATELIWRDGKYQIMDAQPDPADTYDPRERTWYQKAVAHRTSAWTAPYIFFTSQQPGITVASPVFGSGGALKGVIGVDIEIAAISSFLSGLKIGDHGAALILNKNGDVIAHPSPDLIKTKNGDGSFRFTNIDEIDDPIARAAFGGAFGAVDVSVDAEITSKFTHDGANYVSTLMPSISEQLPWTIAVYAPEGDFTGPIKQNRTLNFWIAVVVAVATAIIGLGLVSYIHRPVRSFAMRSELISQGALSASDPMPKTHKELDRLNTTLMHEIAERKKSESEYGRTFDLASRGMVQVEPMTCRFLRVNSALADTLGYTTEELLQMRVEDVAHPDDEPPPFSWRKGASRDVEQVLERRYIRKDGGIVCARVNAIVIRDDDGSPIHAVATVDDVTEAKVAAQKIRELNRDLSHFARVNVMGQMAAGLAHELNQPLTAITQNADAAIMTATEQSEVFPELIEILEEIDQQAHRAGDIIRALRSFVRKDEGSKTTFDFKELVEQALSLTHAEAIENNVVVSFRAGNLPKVYGVRVQIAQVLVSLLRNSIEAIAAGGGNKGEAKVSAELAGDHIKLCVDDSGPGVAPGLDLFSQFETNKKAGKGLGLSISRAIVDANDGKLWHDPEVTDGARFCFTVLVAKANP